MRREIFSQEHELFRDQFRRFADREIVPRVEGCERPIIIWVSEMRFVIIPCQPAEIPAGSLRCGAGTGCPANDTGV